MEFVDVVHIPARTAMKGNGLGGLENLWVSERLIFPFQMEHKSPAHSLVVGSRETAQQDPQKRSPNLLVSLSRSPNFTRRIIQDGGAPTGKYNTNNWYKLAKIIKGVLAVIQALRAFNVQ